MKHNLRNKMGQFRRARSLAQLEQTARNLIRQAYAMGWNTDDLVIDFATEAMGEEYRPLIGRVFARDFTTFTAN